MYEYQREGIRWISALFSRGVGCLLADEMGLGKTAQAIGAIAALPRQTGAQILVVGTSSILENWRRELHRFAPQLRTIVHRGQSRTGFPSELKRYDVVVTSYDLLVRDGGMLGLVEWEVVVFDEAQYVKNSRAQRAIAARAIPAAVRLAVTGTPIENTLADLWSLMDLCNPGVLGDEASFRSQFPDEPTAASRLRSAAQPFLLRRTVLAVASDLPDRVDIPTPLQLSDAEAQDYERIRQEGSSGTGDKLATLQRLRQFCAHPSLLENLRPEQVAETEKLRRTVEIGAEIVASGEKFLVFAAFTGALDLLAAELSTNLGIVVDVIDGRTPPEKRQAVVDSFSDRAGSAVLLLNPRAAGVGLNISAANHVIHYTPEWNPAVQDQATARAYRRGQVRPVFVHRLFYADTVEEVMEHRLSDKRDLQVAGLAELDSGEVKEADLLRALAKSPFAT